RELLLDPIAHERRQREDRERDRREGERDQQREEARARLHETRGRSHLERAPQERLRASRGDHPAERPRAQGGWPGAARGYRGHDPRSERATFRRVLERAALHQTRFRTPGVSPDARGVVLGQKGVVLFPSLDRLVAFLRAYGEEGSLDELLPTLSIRRVVTPLKTREILLSCGSESGYRMDRVASVAKLAGGLVFTGTARHFVKYRDAASPLGYDVEEILDERADVILYHDSFRQAYAYDREIAF